jgi:hypothetical protein
MRALIVANNGQLDRIERTLAEIETLPLAVQLRKTALLQALRQEKVELLRYSPHLRGTRAAAGQLAAD